MREKLMQLLALLEAAIPPGDEHHHSITYCQYGSVETDWTNKLGLNVKLPNGWQTFFLEDCDLDKHPEALVDEICAEVSNMRANNIEPVSWLRG